MPTLIDPQNKPRRLRAQVTDPISGKRVNVYADDQASLDHRCARLRGIRDDLRAGIINREQAAQLCRPIVSGPLTMTDAFERYMATLKPESKRIALANWRARLAKWFGGCAPQELTRERLAKWQIELQKTTASATIKNSYDQLAACCRMLVDSGDLQALPWGDVSKFRGGSGWRPDKVVAQKKMRCCTTMAEVVALLAVAQADDRTKWDQGLYSDRSLVVGFLILTGLRQAEAAGLSWQSCLLESTPPLLRIDRQGRRGWNQRTSESAPHEPTKTRTDRSQVLHPTAVKILRAQRAELLRRGWYRFDGPVWPGRAGEWRTSGVVIKPERMKEYARAAGLPFPDEWTTHSTRHSFACLEVVASRGDLKRVQARTGHADVRQLEGYLHYAGNLLGASDVPEVPIEAPSFGKLPDGAGDLVAGDPWGITQLPDAPPVENVTRDAALKWKEQRKADRAWVARECKKTFPELAIEWLASLPSRKAAKDSELPVSVRIKAKQAYSRGYRQAERKGLSPELCAKAGKHGRQGVLGAWGKAVKAALRSHSYVPRLPPATVDLPPPDEPA